MAFITLIKTELDEILKGTLSLREDRSSNISCSQIPDEEDKRPSRHHYLDISAGSIRRLFFTLDSVCWDALGGIAQGGPICLSVRYCYELIFNNIASSAIVV